MRSVFLAISTAVAFLFPAVAPAQITLVHVTSCGPGVFPGTSCTIPATGGGNLIVVGFEVAGGASASTKISSMTDNAGNVYAEAGAAWSIDTANSSVGDIWYAKNSVAGATSVTITPNASASNGAAVIWEFAGADGTAPLDQAAALNSQASTASPSGASVTTTAAGEVVVSLAEVSQNVTGIYSGNPFSSDSTLQKNGWAHLITSSAGTYAAQWSESPAGTYGSSTASFKPAGAFSACDLNQDGSVDIVDVQWASNMVDIGPPQWPCPASLNWCTANTYAAVITAALPGGACLLPVLGAPAVVSFGNVPIGTQGTQTLTVSGAGSGSTAISQATLSGSPFGMSGPSLPLNPPLAVGQSANFSVTFNPPGVGPFNGTVTFVSNPPNGAINSPVTVALTGAGVHWVYVTWNASSSSGVVGYNLYRATSAGGPFTTPLNSSPITTTCGSVFCYIDSSSTLAPGQTYYYVATAVDNYNNQSPDSAPPVQVTVPSP